MAVLGLLGLGFLLGIKHAFDADHVAAVSAMATDNNSIKKSSLLGMFWGFGHTISLLIAGLAVLLLKITIPEKLALSFEFIVGVMLVALGINVFATINKNRIHFHSHSHGKEEHVHFHSHKSLHRPLIIGLVHGLAGSAAISVLVLATINSLLLGLVYILVFGIGSIMGMMAISSIISLPFALVPKNLETTQKILKISAGLASAITGLIMII